MQEPTRVPDDPQFQPSPADLEEFGEYCRLQQLAAPLPTPETDALQVGHVCDRCGERMLPLGREWVCPDCTRFFPADRAA